MIKNLHAHSQTQSKTSRASLTNHIGQMGLVSMKRKRDKSRDVKLTWKDKYRASLWTGQEKPQQFDRMEATIIIFKQLVLHLTTHPGQPEMAKPRILIIPRPLDHAVGWLIRLKVLTRFCFFFSICTMRLKHYWGQIHVLCTKHAKLLGLLLSHWQKYNNNQMLKAKKKQNRNTDQHAKRQTHTFARSEKQHCNAV